MCVQFVWQQRSLRFSCAAPAAHFFVLEAEDMPFIPQNRFLQCVKNHDAEHFTSDFGIHVRRFIHPLIRGISRIAADKPLKVLQYPRLEKGLRYIFAAGHSFPGEIASNLAVIDRPRSEEHTSNSSHNVISRMPSSALIGRAHV